MKRVIIPIELPRSKRTFELEIQEPGKIHLFVLGYRKASIVSAVSPAGDVMEIIPTIFVEVNPDALARKRSFAVAETGEVINADGHFEYRGSAASQTGILFHLFEEIEVN